jgi:hypothetical protein
VLGSGTPLPKFIPSKTLQGSSDSAILGMELLDGTSQLFGTPLTMAGQQMLAAAYGRSSLGFGGDTVSFQVEWLWMPAGIFTVNREGWVQG